MSLKRVAIGMSRGLGWLILTILAVAGSYQCWQTGSWVRQVATLSDLAVHTETPKDSEEAEEATTRTLEPGPSVVYVVLTGQLPLPTQAQLVDEAYILQTSNLISLCRPILAAQGRLKQDEKRRAGKLRLHCIPGKEACLYVPVSSTSLTDGWRPIILKDTECVLGVPDTHAPSPPSLLARQ